MSPKYCVKPKRRYFLLIEVLIAFAIIVAALLPLLYPHFYIYKEQRQFIQKIDLDMAVNNLYADILQRMQNNQISWDQIEGGREMPINERDWSRINPKQTIPFKGSYRFTVESGKKNDEYGVYLLNMIVQVVPLSDQKKKPMTFNYQIFATRLFKKEQRASSNE